MAEVEDGGKSALIQANSWCSELSRGLVGDGGDNAKRTERAGWNNAAGRGLMQNKLLGKLLG